MNYEGKAQGQTRMYLLKGPPSGARNCTSAANDCGVEGKSICKFAHFHPLNLCVQWILCAINTRL